jgi:hypothetical protein
LPLVEIEDQILAELQRKAAELPTAKTFMEMFDKIGKSEDRTAILKLVKKHFPDTPIPELDAAKPIYDAVEELKAELAKEREDRAKEKAEREKAEVEAGAKREIANYRRELRAQGWDDEGIEKIETRMREKQNPDWEAAALWVKAQMPETPAIPTTFSGQRFDWFTPPKDGADDHQLLMKDPRKFQDKQVADFLREIKSRPRAA